MTQVLLGEKYDWFPAVGSEELLLVPKLYTQEKCDHEFLNRFVHFFAFYFLSLGIMNSAGAFSGGLHRQKFAKLPLLI